LVSAGNPTTANLVCGTLDRVRLKSNTKTTIVSAIDPSVEKRAWHAASIGEQ
jgi:hypothetical protein